MTARRRYYLPNESQTNKTDNANCCVFPWGNPDLFQSPRQSQGSEIPDCVKCVTTLFPATKDVHERFGFPIGIFVNPSNTFSNNIPMMRAHQCRQCHAFPICGNEQNGRCAFCKAPFMNIGSNECNVYDVETSISPRDPVFVFIIDLSQQAMEIGFTTHLIYSIKAAIDSMNDCNKVCLITMGDELTVFDFHINREIVISDLSIIPEIKCVMRPLSEVKDLFKSALNHLNERKPSNSHCIGSAFDLVEKMLVDTGGLVIAGFSGLPSNGPHKLGPRSDDTDVALLRLPVDGSGNFFRNISFRLNRIGVSLHLFCIGPAFTDLAVLGIPSGLTGGLCHYYESFTEETREMIYFSVFQTMVTDYLWDCSMLIKATNGVKIRRVHGNCTIRQGSTINFPVFNPHDIFAFELSPPFSVSDYITIQIISEYGYKGGHYIRVMNIKLRTTSDILQLRDSIDELSLFSLITKQSLTTILANGSKEALNMLYKKAESISARGFKGKSLPYLLHSLACSNIFQSSQSIDSKIADIISLRPISPLDLVLRLYPRLIPGWGLPVELQTAAFSQSNIFVVHTDDKIYVWASPQMSAEQSQALFGVENPSLLPVQSIPNITSPQNMSLWETIDECRMISRKYLPVEFIPSGSSREYIFNRILRDEITVCGENFQTFLKRLLWA